MNDIKNDVRKTIQDWIDAEVRAGRSVDETRLNQFIQVVSKRFNNTPRDEFDGLTPMDMNTIMHKPFSSQCVVELNKLSKEQYEKIPLIRQALFLLNTLGEKELKLTKRGWLPLKIVAETYRLGQPEWIVEEYGAKRYYEYDVLSVYLARIILEVLGWTKMRKGVLSLTVKGKKALSNIDSAANEMLNFSLFGGGLHLLDGNDDNSIGNEGMAYSVWLLGKYGEDWHTGNFYQRHYQNVFDFPDAFNIYETRVFKHLFYWLGIVEKRRNREVGPPYENEYKKTELLSMIFSFKKA